MAYNFFVMIKELREKSGLSQQDFAEKYNIPVCTLRQWEQQRRKAPDYVYSLLKTVVNEDLSKANDKEPLNHAPINSWQNERRNHYVFPVVVGPQEFSVERIHPLNQAKVVDVYKILKSHAEVKEAYIFGSSTNLRCNVKSDVDIAILLDKPKDNMQLRAAIGEEISKACNWQCDIVWLCEEPKDSQLYQGIMQGERII